MRLVHLWGSGSIEGMNPVELISYAHPFRWLYTLFWAMLAGICLYFLQIRPDGILWAGLIGSILWGVVTFFSRRRISLQGDFLLSEMVPALWRRSQTWHLGEIEEVMIESSLGVDQRETTRPLRYTILVHEASGRFRPLIVVHREDQALDLIEAIERARKAVGNDGEESGTDRKIQTA